MNEERIQNMNFGGEQTSTINLDGVSRTIEMYKDKLDAFLSVYSVFDILGFLFAMILGLLFLILAVSLRKRLGVMFLMLLLSIASFGGGPFFMKFMVDTIVRKTTIENLDVKQLVYTRAVIVRGTLVHSGKMDLKDCVVKVEIWKKATKMIDEYIRYVKKPTYKQEFEVVKSLPLGSTYDFQVVYDDFRLDENQEVVVKSKCK